MRALLAFAFLTLAACGPPAQPGYTPEYSFGFTQSCTARSGSHELCTCIWGKIETNVSRADFDALERMTPAEREVHPLNAQIQGYAVECAANLPQPAVNPGVEPETVP